MTYKQQWYFYLKKGIYCGLKVFDRVTLLSTRSKCCWCWICVCAWFIHQSKIRETCPKNHVIGHCSTAIIVFAWLRLQGTSTAQHRLRTVNEVSTTELIADGNSIWSELQEVIAAHMGQRVVHYPIANCWKLVIRLMIRKASIAWHILVVTIYTYTC